PVVQSFKVEYPEVLLSCIASAEGKARAFSDFGLELNRNLPALAGHVEGKELENNLKKQPPVSEVRAMQDSGEVGEHRTGAGHCLCMEVQTEDGTGHASPIPAFLPPKHHQGHGFSTVKQTLEITGCPQLRACLPTYHGQGLSSGQPPCAMLHHQCGTPIMQQQHLSENSRLNSSLAESSAKGNIFGQLGARRTLAPWVLAKGHAHQQRQKLLLSQSENFTSTAVRLEHRPHLLMVQKKLSHSSGGQVAGTSSWHLLTEGRPSIEEVGHHLTLALDLDHTAALQLAMLV
ncbi:LOW QUALITY PROTEIN: hypothetical protein U0070_024711, partial [Myodes glareolus]